jgi:hypothetical protein
MKMFLSLSCIVVCATFMSCSRDKESSQNGPDSDAGTGAGSSSAKGFEVIGSQLQYGLDRDLRPLAAFTC